MTSSNAVTLRVLRRISSAVLLGALLSGAVAGCGSDGGATSTGLGGGASPEGSGATYDHPVSPAVAAGFASCGAALPQEMLASVGLSASLAVTPGEFERGDVRWTGTVSIRNDGDALRVLTPTSSGTHVVLADDGSGRVGTVALPASVEPASVPYLEVAPGQSVDLGAAIDSYVCPPPGDPRLSADGTVDDVQRAPDGSHAVVVVLNVGNDAYRSEPIEVVLGKS